MYYDRSRYVNVVNEYGASVTTKVAIKQLCYMSITPMLKRLYLYEEIAKQMEWHKEGKRDSKYLDIILYPTDSKAWEVLYRFDLEFARDPSRVHLGLSTDGFQSHSEASSLYSCWPVFVMPYNLPLNRCLKQCFIFLSLVIPGPKESKKQVNIFLRLLMEEMKELWQGVDTYDNHLKHQFNLSVIYLWSTKLSNTYG
jgi:hypothetical protein